MNVLLFGATGFLGGKTLQQLLAAGHQVTVLVRDASKIQPQRGLRIVQGQILHPADVHAVMQGQDAVIQALGYNGKGNGKPTTLSTDATRIVIEAMQAAGVKRLIAMSVVGAGNSISFFPRLLSRFIFPCFMRWFVYIIDDKNSMEPLVMSSGLDWTLVRSITIKDERPAGRVRTTFDGKGMKYSVSVEDVATFLVEQLSSREFVHQAPTISK